jgi:hypothetical protein
VGAAVMQLARVEVRRAQVEARLAREDVRRPMGALQST